jgi:glycosyltransferase involved in cell wall biosynthesis
MSDADISVITVVLNDVSGLRKTIDSVLSQKYTNIQHIIVDGGSTDGSQTLASENSSVHVVSMKDGGIYQGMQRGAELASAPFIMFVNSSDQLEGSDNLHKSIQQMRQSKSLWGFGPILEDTIRSSLRLSSSSGEITLNNIASRKTFIPFPVVIMNRVEFFRVGGFKFDYKIAGDFDLIVRLTQNSLPIRWDYPLVKFSAGGISYTKPVTAWKEEHTIRVINLNLNVFGQILSYLKFIKRILRWLAGKFLDMLQSTGIFGQIHWRDRS